MTKRELRTLPMKEQPMKIVAVNTFGGSAYEVRPERLPEGPWNFDYSEMLRNLPELFLIEIASPNDISNCYKVVGVKEVFLKKGVRLIVRVIFDLTKCSPEDEALVREAAKNKPLSGYSHKKLY